MPALVTVRELPVRVQAIEQTSAGQYLVPVRRCGLAKVEPAAMRKLEKINIIPEDDDMTSNEKIEVAELMRKVDQSESADDTTRLNDELSRLDSAEDHAMVQVAQAGVWRAALHSERRS